MAEEAKEAAPQVKKGGKLKWIMIGLLGLGLLGNGAFLAFRYLNAAASTEAAAESSAEDAPGSEEESAPEAGKRVEVKSTMSLDSFLVNLADAEVPRFVKVTFRLGFDEKGMGEKLEKNQVVLAMTRDAIITVLSSKTADEILTQEGKNNLRKDIMDRVNAILPEGKIHEVYIMDFQVQL